MQTVTAFSGFEPDAVQFLADLATNNSRDWFQPRKGDYERLLKRPLEQLCVALGELFAARGIPLISDPVHSPMRIYRDIRFSKDKSPYKANIAANFPWGVGEQHGPGGYFHFQPGEMFVGGGMWHPESSRLGGWRAAVVQETDRVRRALNDPGFVSEFGAVEGDRLKRVPPGFPADHPEAELLKLKDITFGRELTQSEALSPDLPDVLCSAFAAAMPVMALLASLSS
jgi:uncharacterized protein (TIGR02453 family)